MKRRLAVIATLSVMVAACGQGGQGVGSKASVALGPDVAAVKSAVAKGDLPAAQAAVDRLRHDVGQLEATGSVSPDAAGRVLKAADEVTRQLGPAAATTSTTASTRPAPPAPSSETTHHSHGDHGDQNNGD